MKDRGADVQKWNEEIQLKTSKNVHIINYFGYDKMIKCTATLCVCVLHKFNLITFFSAERKVSFPSLTLFIISQQLNEIRCGSPPSLYLSVSLAFHTHTNADSFRSFFSGFNFATVAHRTIV